MRVVLDCNVLISAAITDGTCRATIQHAVERDDIYVSDEILAEYRGVAVRPRYLEYRANALSLISVVESVAHQVEPLEWAPSLPDPQDSVYLAVALAAQGDAIVTGNIKDFPQDLCAPIKILKPRQYLDACS